MCKKCVYSTVIRQRALAIKWLPPWMSLMIWDSETLAHCFLWMIPLNIWYLSALALISYHLGGNNSNFNTTCKLLFYIMWNNLIWLLNLLIPDFIIDVCWGIIKDYLNHPPSNLNQLQSPPPMHSALVPVCRFCRLKPY